MLQKDYLFRPLYMMLDEATSSLDTSSENFIQKAIQSLRNNNKTIIVIAHRLSTVVHADTIVVLDNGKSKSLPIGKVRLGI